DLLPGLHRRARLRDRPHRPGALLPGVPAPDGALASDASAGAAPRGPLRVTRRRPRVLGSAHARAPRPALGCALSPFPPPRPTRVDCEQLASAAADRQGLDRPMAALRALSGAAARRARRRDPRA